MVDKNYYDKLGSILSDALSSDEDPFKASLRSKGKYRKIAGRMERRPAPKVNKELKRIAVPPELVEDFAVLNVLPGVPLEDCKRAWKNLVKKYHPDLNSTQNERIDIEQQNSVIRRINNSYKKIETWFKTGKILEEKDLNS